eukprot:10610123-Lingulodinium_polyedra.AAC.1
MLLARGVGWSRYRRARAAFPGPGGRGRRCGGCGGGCGLRRCEAGAARAAAAPGAMPQRQGCRGA